LKGVRRDVNRVFLQSTKDATKFYEGKVSELGVNLKDLESIVQGKSNNLRVVEDGMFRDLETETVIMTSSMYSFAPESYYF
jgi:hypothetical protein